METDSGRALRLAVINNNIEQVKALLDEGVDVDSADNAGWTPLMIAVRRKYYDIAQFLLDKGASVDNCFKNGRGANALGIAIKNRNLSLVLEMLNRSTTKPDYSKLLFTAITYSHIPLVKYLLETSGDPEINFTPPINMLFLAIQNNDVDIIRLLLEHGMDANKRQNYGASAVMLAFTSRNVEILSLLIKYGADVATVDHSGYSPLAIAKNIQKIGYKTPEQLEWREVAELVLNASKAPP